MITEIDTDTSVAELVRQRPARARIFDEFGIDYCCHGQVPLEQACAHQGANPADVCRRLADVESDSADEKRDWTAATLTELTEHIVTVHHTYLRRELPRLAGMIDRVVGAHGERHPELRQVREVFASLQCELLSHMIKEEQVLFPMVRQLERTKSEERGALRFHCGSIRNPIRMMEHEHDVAGVCLRKIAELTYEYTPPDDACETNRALLAGLAELQADLHRHIHKENNILFPAATALEAVH